MSIATLAAVFQAIGTAATTTVDAESDASFVTVGTTTNLVVVNSPTVAPALTALTPDQGGALYPPGSDAVTVNNPNVNPVTILAQSSAFIELASGSATVIGGDAPTFVVDATHNSSPALLQAGSGQSYLLGGPGADTLTGSTSQTGHATLVAKGGPTLLEGGLGADSLYAGGHTNAIGGPGAGQQLFGGFSVNASDTLQAGTGGHQALGVAAGNNLLVDLNGNGTDTLFSGTGSDTLIGGAAGTIFALGQGHATVNGGTGSDNIYVAKGAISDVINGGGGSDFVTFNGYSHSDATVKTDSSGVTTVTFGATGQTAILTNITSIAFGNDSVSHS